MSLLRSFTHNLRSTVLPHPDSWTLFSLLLSSSAFFLAWRTGQAHPMNEISQWQWPVVLALSGWVGVATRRSAINAIVESEAEKKSLQIKIAEFQAKPAVKPHLDFQIHDAFINPSANTATVFLHVSLHNVLAHA